MFDCNVFEYIVNWYVRDVYYNYIKNFITIGYEHEHIHRLGRNMKFQEFADILVKDINNGIYKHNDKLPTEDTLIEAYGVSRYCVRKAINTLIKDGEVYSIQGSGMFIRKGKRQGCLNLATTKGLTSEFAGQVITTKVIKIESIQADEDIALKMHCELGTWCYYLERLRYIDDEPISVEYTYYNKELIPHIDNEIASGSLFGYIKEELGLSLGYADKIISCGPLDDVTAGLLGLTSSSPTLIVEDEAYLSNGQLFNTSRIFYHYEKTKFFGSRSVI